MRRPHFHDKYKPCTCLACEALACLSPEAKTPKCFCRKAGPDTSTHGLQQKLNKSKDSTVASADKWRRCTSSSLPSSGMSARALSPLRCQNSRLIKTLKPAWPGEHAARPACLMAQVTESETFSDHSTSPYNIYCFGLGCSVPDLQYHRVKGRLINLSLPRISADGWITQLLLRVRSTLYFFTGRCSPQSQLLGGPSNSKPCPTGT